MRWDESGPRFPMHARNNDGVAIGQVQFDRISRHLNRRLLDGDRPFLFESCLRLLLWQDPGEQLGRRNGWILNADINQLHAGKRNDGVHRQRDCTRAAHQPPRPSRGKNVHELPPQAMAWR